MKNPEFLDKLVHLLGEAVPQAVNYLILASSGEIVAELRTKKKCGDEDECLHKLQADLKAYPRSFPSARSSESGLSYYAFPIQDDQDSFQYILVCAGRECDLDKVYPAYILISKLYKLR